MPSISTLPADELAALLRYFREGGRDNLRALLRRLARHAGAPLDCAEPRVVPRTRRLYAGEQAVDLDRLLTHAAAGQARHADRVLSLDAAGRRRGADRRARARRCAARGLAPAPLFVTSLKDADVGGLRRAACRGSSRR